MSIENDNLLKECSGCKEKKPYTHFGKHKKEKDGHYYLCKICAKKQKDKNKLNTPFPNDFQKKCPSCKIIKNAYDFGPCTGRKDGIQYRCKKCALSTTRQQRNSIEGRITFIYNNAKRNLERATKTLEMTITKNDLIELYRKQDGYCALSGIKMEHTIHNDEHSIDNKYNISLDRIHSDIGYVKDNIQLVCWIVNHMKSDIKPDLFIELITKIHNTSVINHL
jgi:hypothetical protein